MAATFWPYNYEPTGPRGQNSFNKERAHQHARLEGDSNQAPPMRTHGRTDPKSKTTYEERVARIPVRDHPTYQSSLFTGHGYQKRVGDQHRSTTPTATNMQTGFDRRPVTETGARTHRPTKSFVESQHGHRGVEELRPAGVYQVDTKGTPILTAKLVNVPDVMKVEKPSLPIKDKHTTYNSQHCREGFPYHYPTQKPAPAQVKLSEIEEKVAPGKRHPFEVKKEPLHDKSTTMTVKIPEHLEPEIIKRDLARKGYQVVKSHVPHNTITNERSGHGTMQIRAPNDRYHEEARREIQNIGLKLESTGAPRRSANADLRWK